MERHKTQTKIIKTKNTRKKDITKVFWFKKQEKINKTIENKNKTIQNGNTTIEKGQQARSLKKKEKKESEKRTTL